jgi:uncharacterized membrane-anchored protein YhcB (DUF1043 family)
MVTISTTILILKWMKPSKKKDYENDEWNQRDMKKNLNKYKENADKYLSKIVKWFYICLKLFKPIVPIYQIVLMKPTCTSVNASKKRKKLEIMKKN